MDLTRWAIKWGVPTQAVYELRRLIQVAVPTVDRTGNKPEAEVQARTRLAYSQRGAVLWRNNVGAAHTREGTFFRYGLANDTKAMNAKIKSSDLVGIQPVLIQPAMVGHTIGQFVARECKKSSWVYRATAREIAQLEFIKLVLSLGGDAAFTTGGDGYE